MADSKQVAGFERAAILGIGLIGASFALALKEACLVDEVVGVARRQSTRNAAERLGAADRTLADPQEAVRGADLVYLATPVGTIVHHLHLIAGDLREGCLVTDAGSVKAAICRTAAEALPERVCFAGGHPMAGSERSGPEAARADLFAGNVYFVVPAQPGGDEAVARLVGLVKAIGGRPLLVDASEHDTILAATSHLPHAVAVATMLAVAELVPDERQRADFSAGGLRDTTRIASASPELWRNVFLANAQDLTPACRLTAELLRELADAAEQGDKARLLDLLARAQMAREALSRELSGGQEP